MNFENLPNDIHYHIINQIEYNRDVLNLGKVNRNLKKETNNSISKISVNLFRVKLIFNIQADLNKHCRLCKKFNRLEYYFNKNYYKINIDRKTNYTIFDTSTLIYFNIFVDDFNKFNKTFLRFLHENELYRMLSINNIRYDLFLYFSDESFKQIKEETKCLNRKDILLDSKSDIDLNRFIFKDTNSNELPIFIDILSWSLENMYEIVKIKLVKNKKNFIKLIRNYESLIITKEKIIYSLRLLTLRYKEEKKMINIEILNELDTFEPNIPKVDKLVEELNAKSIRGRYIKNIIIYLQNEKIELNDFPEKK